MAILLKGNEEKQDVLINNILKKDLQHYQQI